MTSNRELLSRSVKIVANFPCPFLLANSSKLNRLGYPQLFFRTSNFMKDVLDSILTASRFTRYAHFFIFADLFNCQFFASRVTRYAWSVIFRKVTNGFRSDWGRDLFAAVRSIVNTGKRQGLSAFESILTALNPLESLFPLS